MVVGVGVVVVLVMVVVFAILLGARGVRGIVVPAVEGKIRPMSASESPSLPRFRGRGKARTGRTEEGEGALLELLRRRMRWERRTRTTTLGGGRWHPGRGGSVSLAVEGQGRLSTRDGRGP